MKEKVKKKSEKWYRPHTALFLILEKFSVTEICAVSVLKVLQLDSFTKNHDIQVKFK